MNGQAPYHFGTMTRRPSVRQFLANDLVLTLLSLTGLAVAGIDGMMLGDLLFLFSTAILLCLVYRLCYLRSMRFTLTGEQLVYEHGVFHRTCDYMELYRVVDFREESSLIQRMLGLKTVMIYSGDRSTPRLDLIGMDKNDNLIPVIRERVTANRRKNGIYEITNR
ncbi:MAG: PH domain-containing protein [Roseburia sp.]|nr:PH domain-containing protein [Roseburia sp.]MCM1420471.1 PH domain-containing protein [Bacteroides sp.]